MGGGFSFYACRRFGSKNVVYNDHNPIITNLLGTLKSDPGGLYVEYQKHRRRSSPDYYLRIRSADLGDGLVGAGRFFYLAKNAFSGKIRFNSKNGFNSPMRKNTKCPQINRAHLESLSEVISSMRITTRDFTSFKNVRGSFLYLDPPYMNNTNGHYDATVQPGLFSSFVDCMDKSNKIMISEQNEPHIIGLGRNWKIHRVRLDRSLQYFTQVKSREIVAINYSPGGS